MKNDLAFHHLVEFRFLRGSDDALTRGGSTVLKCSISRPRSLRLSRSMADARLLLGPEELFELT